MEKPIRVGLTAARMLRLVIPVIVVVLSGRTFDADAQTETTLWQFTSSVQGFTPVGGLTQGSDGNFYGTTEFGGTFYSGTVFRISQGGDFTNLASFDGGNGAWPHDGLVQGRDGNLYGAITQGGMDFCGTVTRFTPGSGLTNLHSFSFSDGSLPYGVPVQGSDGNFYGTTSYGGTNGSWGSGSGTVFRFGASGAFVKLYSFGSQPNDGAYPYGSLLQGSDSNFYGTTYSGGASGYGTVFRIASSGTLTILYSFRGSDGANPSAGLVQGSDGDFYGTTDSGGTNSCDCGTVFRISPSGSYTSLYSFAGFPNDGSDPYAGLVQGSDGNFYGTTGGGGTNSCDCGTVFRISTSGSYTSLYSFAGFPNDGADPQAGLVQGTDGNFYGTSILGGTNNEGTVFKLSVPLSPAANQISEIQFFNIFDTTIVALPIPSVAGETYQLQYSDSMSPTNWLNTGGTITSFGGPLVLIDLAEPLPPQRFYRAVITP